MDREKYKLSWKRYRGILCILFFSSFLIMYNLTNQCLWNDEASTANISYNTMKYGLPKIYDGINLLSTADGNSFNDDLLVTNYEWLQFYIMALSFKLFGKTVFAARAPFAIIGIATILVIWLLAEKIYHNYKRSNIITILYCLNMQFILYCRQARNYTLAIFFMALSTLLLFVILDMLRVELSYSNLKLGIYLILFSLAITCNMNSGRLLGVTWLLAFLLYLILLHNKKFLLLLIPSFIGFFTWLVWYIYTHVIIFAPSFGTSAVETHFITKIIMILWKIQVYFLPFVSLVLIYLIFLILHRVFYKRQTYLVWKHSNWFFILLIISNIVITAFPKWGIVNHYYLGVLVSAPFIIYPILLYIWDNSKFLCTIIFFAMLTTNVLHIWPYYLLIKPIQPANNEVNNLLSDHFEATTNYGLISSPDTNSDFRTTSLNSYRNKLKIKSYFYEYLREITSDYKCDIDEIIDVFKRNNVNGDNVVVVGFEYDPLIFYSNIRIANNLNEKLLPWPDYFTEYPNQKKYSYLTYVPDNEIDWVILKASGYMQNYVDDVNYFTPERFDTIQSKTVDLSLANSPDLDIHNFVTVTEGNKFIILKRKSR